MQELLDFSLTTPIIGYTIFFMMMILYWLMVIVGALDLGSFDVDFDFDADVDVDVDIDIEGGDVSGGSVEGASFFFAALQFFNFGRVPFMLIMTFLSISMWAMAVLVNESFNDGNWWFSLVIFIPILFVGLIITKVVTFPFIGIFTHLMKGDAQETDFVGLIATTILPHQKDSVGQIEISIDGRYMRLNTSIAKHWNGSIPNDTKVIITGNNEEKSIFYIKPLEA